jgi:hypothetical protein
MSTSRRRQRARVVQRLRVRAPPDNALARRRPASAPCAHAPTTASTDESGRKPAPGSDVCCSSLPGVSVATVGALALRAGAAVSPAPEASGWRSGSRSTGVTWSDEARSLMELDVERRPRIVDRAGVIATRGSLASSSATRTLTACAPRCARRPHEDTRERRSGEASSALARRHRGRTPGGIGRARSDRTVGRFRVVGVHAGAAVDRLYKRPCPRGYTGVRGAGVQYERRGADDATRATDK